MRKLLSCVCILSLASSAYAIGPKIGSHLLRATKARPGVLKPSYLPEHGVKGFSYLPGQLSAGFDARYAPDIAPNKIGALLSRAAAEGQRAAVTNLLNKSVYNKELVEQNIKSALVEVFDKGVTATTGFIFMGREDGKEKLWIAFSYHGVGGKGAPVDVRFTFLDGTQQKDQIQVAVAGRGMRNGADMALAQLPEKYKNQVFALRWASEEAKAGEYVDSYGFSMYPFRMYEKTADRYIKSVSGYKIITTNQFAVSGLGACGSPLVNAEGYVVGLHQSSFQNENYALNRLVTEDLLRLYYTGKALRPLKVNGQTIGEIDIGEQISAVMIMRNGQLIMEYQLQQHTGKFAYDKLEDIPSARPGDEVRMLIADLKGNSRLVTFLIERN